MGPLLLVLLLLPAPAWAAEVYVNNRPFSGLVAGPPEDLLLEAEALFRLVRGEFAFDPETGTATLDGVPLAVEIHHGVVYVRGREVVRQLRGRYQVNPSLGVVDLYAFDPAESARRAWRSVLAKKQVLEGFDFRVLTWLVRKFLEADLGLALEAPVELVLADEEAMERAGLGTGVIGGVSLLRREGLPHPRIRFLVRGGAPPLSVVGTLAFNWGVTWSRLQGLPRSSPLADGFGLWTSYYLLGKLGAELGRRDYGTWQGAAEHAAFLELCRLQDRAGSRAVVDFVRREAKNSGW